MRDELAASNRRVPEVRHGHLNGWRTDWYWRVRVIRRLDTISTHDDHIRDRQHPAADG